MTMPMPFPGCPPWRILCRTLWHSGLCPHMSSLCLAHYWISVSQEISPQVIKEYMLSPKFTPQPGACLDNGLLGRKGQVSWATSVLQLGDPPILDEAGKYQTPCPLVFHRAWRGKKCSCDLSSQKWRPHEMFVENTAWEPTTPPTQTRALDSWLPREWMTANLTLSEAGDSPRPPVACLGEICPPFWPWVQSGALSTALRGRAAR